MVSTEFPGSTRAVSRFFYFNREDSHHLEGRVSCHNFPLGTLQPYPKNVEFGWGTGVNLTGALEGGGVVPK